MKKIILLTLLCSFYANANDNQSKPSEVGSPSVGSTNPASSGAIYGGVNSNYTYGNNYVTTFIRTGVEDKIDPSIMHYYQGSEIKRLSHSNFGFGGFIGYAHRLNKTILMSGISYDANKLKEHLNKQEMLADNNGEVIDINENYGIGFTRGATWSGNIRLGYLVEPPIAVFIKAGLLFSSFSLNFNTKGLAKGNNKKLMGFEPGAGIDIKILNNIFFRGEYGYQMFKKFTTTNINSHPNAEPDSKAICSVSPRYHVIRLGFGYKFSTF